MHISRDIPLFTRTQFLAPFHHDAHVYEVWFEERSQTVQGGVAYWYLTLNHPRTGMVRYILHEEENDRGNHRWVKLGELNHVPLGEEQPLLDWAGEQIIKKAGCSPEPSPAHLNKKEN